MTVLMTVPMNIPLGHDQYAVVDSQDYERVMAAGPWHIEGRAAKHSRSLTSEYLILQRFVMGLGEGDTTQVGFIDKDFKNCQRSNLIVRTKAQIMVGSPKRAGCSSPYKGVIRRRSGAFEAYVYKDYKKISLGLFVVETDAASARDAAAFEIWGDLARLNFPKE